MLTLEQACIVVDTALAVGRERKLKPLTVAVLDAGGHLVALKREDGAGMLRVEVAIGKAYGAVGVGVSSRALGVAAVERPHFGTALAMASGGRLIPVPGGVLIRDNTGTIVGAVGISGDTSDNDELCGIRGVQAAGLTSDPAQPQDQ
jgi:uncharacterized protein GlcG (DUF336 family)